MQIVPSKVAHHMPTREALHAYLEDAIAFVTQSLRGEIPVELKAWPLSMQADIRFQAEGLINRFDDRHKRDATLRAREQVAISGFGADYSRLSPSQQNRVNQYVQIAVQSYEAHLQGLTEPVPATRANELQPEHERRKVS